MRALEHGATASKNGGLQKSAILILIWASSTVWWSIFTPPARTFAARILLFQPLWSFRVLKQDVSWQSDLSLTLLVHAVYSFWTGRWTLPSARSIASIDLGHHGLRIYLELFTMLGICGSFAGLIVHCDHQHREAEANPVDDKRIDEELMPPLLIPSKTTHTRLFPQKHSFAYSYLLVGIPIGTSGRISKALSIDGKPPAWFNVRAEDYLDRGTSIVSLAEKLKAYLHTQGVTDRDYAFAYLVTAPRFLGYSFNPVSFWYLYDSDTCLKYMILEVNNTFDERRLYLLKADRSVENDPSLDEAEGPDLETASKSSLFTDTWQKDFHVSPFNSRKGSYSLRAVDPLAVMQETGHLTIDNTIVLRSSKEHPKLVARIFSTSKPTHTTRVSTTQLMSFILSWWWVGLLTFPRIVYQAKNLFFARSLHVWFRPEVTPSSLGRAYTSAERDLELFFRAFLTSAVESAKLPLRVVYRPPHHHAEDIEISSQNSTYEESQSKTLDIRVSSPAFYSRFIHYAHAKEAFDREALTAGEKNRTCLLSPPTLLPVLLEAIAGLPDLSKSARSLRWRFQRALRCPPPPVAYPTTSMTTTDIRKLPVSELDTFVRRECSDGNVYRRICTEQFLAQRFFFGLPVLVATTDWLIRAGIVLMAARFASNSDVFDVLRPRPILGREWVEVVQLLMLANGLHIWSTLKG